MSYFKTSYATLKRIAQAGRYEDVAGFLVLARHASGLPHAGFEPYKLSGAGVNSIHEKAGLSEEAARGVIERLQTQEIISTPTAETKKAFFHARWEISQGMLDLDLPHALTDSAKDGSTDSALRRLKKHRIAMPSYAKQLEEISDTELRLDALMTLLALYRDTAMCDFGGVKPRSIRRPWEVKSQSPKLGAIRWGAEPEDKYVSNHAFMGECINHPPPRPPWDQGKSKKIELTDGQKTRFWNAWNTIRETGLVYEAVALYDTAPAENDKARLQLTLRVNDYHAGATVKRGDPSLLRAMELLHGTRFAFYTPKVNEREESEAMWVVLPDRRGALVGVWRPRFRASTQDAGRWIDQENERIEATLTAVEATAPPEEQVQ